jgi:hypothetical protein
MASFETQFNNLCKSWNLDIADVKIVSILASFHEIERAIYQRNDTQQYLYIETEDSYRDGVDDYFKWFYITENEKNEEIAKYKKHKL